MKDYNRQKWLMFKSNIQNLRKIQHSLTRQTGEIMIISIWWLPKSDKRPVLDRTPVVFSPEYLNLNTGNVRNERTDQTINIREMLEEHDKNGQR